MIFKPDKEYYKTTVIAFCLIVGGCIAISIDVGWMCFCVIFGIMNLIFIPNWMANGRTFIMNENGCVVCFLWYRKEYKWDDFQVKGIEDFSHAREYKNTYTRGAVFSPRRIRKPWWWTPSLYCWRLHPLSFVFVNFTPKERWFGTSPIYEIDEKKFMEKMKEWNVELEELNFYK